MADPNQTITLESLSATPLSTETPPVEEEEQQVVQPQAPVPAPVEPQAPQDVFAPVGDQPPPAPIAIPRPVPEVPAVGPQEPVDEFTGVEPRDIQTTEERPLPALFPSFVEKARTIGTTDPRARAAEFQQLRTEISDNYTRGVLQTGDEERDAKRKDLITRAASVGIPKLDQNGEVILDSTGQPVIEERVALLGAGIEDQVDRYNRNIISAFEIPQKQNGAFVFYDESGQAIGGINLNQEISKLSTQLQDGFALARGIYRIEGEKGGLSFYDEVLKEAGVKSPVKRLYYLRQQARTGTFSGIEATRTKTGSIDDLLPAIANFGIMIGDFIEDRTMQAPLVLMDMLSEFDVPLDAPDAMTGALRNINRNGNTLPMFSMTADRWAEQEGVSLQEAEAVLGFTPDAATALKRELVATALTFPTILGGIGRMDARTIQAFSQFVAREYRDMIKSGWDGEGLDPSETLDMVEIDRILTAKGVNFDEAFDLFAQQQTMPRAWLEGSLERGIMQRMKNPGPERLEYFKVRIGGLQDRVANLSTKIETATKDLRTAVTREEKKRRQKRLNDLKAQKRTVMKELNGLLDENIVPTFTREFLVDDLAIATPVAALAYSTFYQVTGGAQAESGIGSFVAVLASLSQGVRRGVTYSAEAVKYAAKRGLGFEAPNPAAVTLARRIENAPPELRDRIYEFSEQVSEAVESLGDIRYPAGHQKAGQPILTEDLLYQSFSKMSGLITLRQLQNQASSNTLDIQKDAGKFSEKLLDLEMKFEQRGREINELGEIVLNLKYLNYKENASPKALELLETLDGFYKLEAETLAREKADFDAVMANQKPISSIFTADATAEDVAEYVAGNKSISHALAVEMERFRRYGIDPSLAPEQKEAELQRYLNELQENVAEAFKRHEKYEVKPKYKASNKKFIDWVRLQEAVAHTEASAKFDELKTKYPDDARIDITELHDQLVLEEYSLDDTALNLVVPITGEGTVASRAFQGLNLNPGTVSKLRRLFDRPAAEFLETLRNSGEEATTLVDEIIEEAGLADASPYQQMLVVREGFKEAGAQLPRFGVDVTEYIQIVSALGREGKAKAGRPEVIPVAQLRESLLERGKTEFYSDFYGANPQKIEGLDTDYQAARDFYKTRYIDVYKTDSRSVKAIIMDAGSFDDLNTDAFIKFSREFKLHEPRTAADLQSFVKMFENMIGKPVDVTTPEGKQIRSLLTRFALEQVSNTIGGKKFQEILAGYSEDGIPVVSPAATREIEKFVRDMRAGRISESGVSINLSNFIGRTSDGKYKLVDVNGEPLVNQSVIDWALSFDNYKKFSKDAQDAEVKFFDELEEVKNEWRTQFDIESSALNREINLRRQLTQQLGGTEGGLGRAILGIVNTETGATRLDALRTDYVAAQERAGVPRTEALETFQQVVRQNVIDALFDEVTKPGNKTTFDVVDAAGNSSKETKRMVEIDPERLLSLLGYRGDTVEASKREGQIRDLLGDDVYEHLRTVGDLLYVNESTANKLNVQGISLPLSAESQLSRATSYFRGVISLRWLISEAAVREARRSNFELTKLMLFDPKIGRQVLDLVVSGKYDAERFAQVYPVLLDQIAKNDVLLEGAVDAYQQGGQETFENAIDQYGLPEAGPMEQQMDSLMISP